MNSHKDLLKNADDKKQEGASLVEYALLVALFLAVIAIVALQALGKNVSNTFSQISSSVGSSN